MTADQPSEKYLDTLLRYYEEEVEGEAYFNGIADRLSDLDHQAKMRLMAKVETYAAAAVYPLVRKYGLAPRPDAELHVSGKAQAAKETTGWSELIDRMRKIFPGYIDDFERLETMAPNADLRELKILTAHEVAAIAFLESEAKGEPDSDGPLRLYLETGTA